MISPGSAHRDAPHLQAGASGAGETVTVAYVCPLPGLVGLGGGYTWAARPGGLAALSDDESRVLARSLATLADALGHTMLAFSLVPDVFTLSDLHQVYEAVWGRPLDPPNFRRSLLRTRRVLVDTGQTRPDTNGRPAVLYVRGTAKRLEPPVRRPPT